MKLSELQTEDEILAEHLRDPEFAAAWQASALARAVAIEVVRYRRAHDLSQAALARHLGMHQPQVARIEAGDVTPTMETLVRLAVALDLEIAIDIRPLGRLASLLDRSEPRETIKANDAAVTVATKRATAKRKRTASEPERTAIATEGRYRRSAAMLKGKAAGKGRVTYHVGSSPLATSKGGRTASKSVRTGSEGARRSG